MAGGDVDSDLHWTSLALSLAQGAFLLTGLARGDDENVLKTWQSRLSRHCYNLTSLGLEDQAAAICDWLWLILYYTFNGFAIRYLQHLCLWIEW